MIHLLKKLFGTSADYQALLANGAPIVDVRTAGEYAGGHVKGSVNIPLSDLKTRMTGLEPGKPVITCCASGMRSATAKAMLKANGFSEVHNAGSWTSLKKFEQFVKPLR